MPRLNWLSATPRSAALRNHCDGALVVGALAAAVGVEHGEIVHRLGVAALGRLQIIAPRDIDVLLHARDLFRRRSRAGKSPALRRPAPRGHTISRLRRNWRRCLCPRRSARRFHKPPLHRPSARPRAAPVRRSLSGNLSLGGTWTRRELAAGRRRLRRRRDRAGDVAGVLGDGGHRLPAGSPPTRRCRARSARGY